VPPPDAPAFAYGAQYTVSRLSDGCFEALEAGGAVGEDGSVLFHVRPGLWRVMTNGRLPDGTAAVWMRTVRVGAGETATVEAVLRTAPLQAKSAAQAQVLPEILLAPAEGMERVDDAAALEAVSSNDSVVQDAEAVRMARAAGLPSFLAFLAPGEEPTAHLLQEMREASASFRSCAARCLLLPVRGDAGGMAVLERTAAMTGVPVRTPREGARAVEAVCEAIGQPPLPLPLVLLLDRDGHCIHHLAGYNVGTGGLLLRHLNG